jgi:hypothetical protein
MDEMPIDIDETSTVVAAFHDMRVPDLFVKRKRLVGHDRVTYAFGEQEQAQATLWDAKLC